MPNELLSLAPGVHYFPGAVNQLVLENQQGGALLVDSGLDESRAKALLKAVQASGLTPAAILNTHSHADHHGGNALVRSRFAQLPLYAPALEDAVLRYPLLEPLSLFGARPPRELQGKFLLAPPSEAEPVSAGRVTLGGVEVELLAVPGHAAQMFAVRAGGVLFASDALFGPDALEKHPLTFCVDSAQQKASARGLLELGGLSVVLPGHGEPSADLAGLVAANLAAYERTTDAVRRAAEVEGTIDELLVRVCDELRLSMTSPAAVVLNRAVVSAHLVELLELGEVRQRVEANRWLWRAGT